MIKPRYDAFDIAAGRVPCEADQEDRPDVSEDEIRAYIERMLAFDSEPSQAVESHVVGGLEKFEIEFDEVRSLEIQPVRSRGETGDGNPLVRAAQSRPNIRRGSRRALAVPLAYLCSMAAALVLICCSAFLYERTVQGKFDLARSRLKSLERENRDLQKDLAQKAARLASAEKENYDIKRSFDRDTVWVEKSKSALTEVKMLLAAFREYTNDGSLSLRPDQTEMMENTVNIWLNELQGLERHPVYKGDKSRFIRDVTYPDESSILAGSTIEKTWEIENSGTVTWKGRFLMREGPNDAQGKIGSEKRIPIEETPPGKRIMLTVKLTMPEITGPCYAEWKMVDENGKYLMPAQQPLFSLFKVVPKL